MKTLMFALACTALALMALPQTASAGSGFTICIEGVCAGKGNKDKWRDRDRYRWQQYCYDNPWDRRCDYRPRRQQRCYNGPYGWECY